MAQALVDPLISDGLLDPASLRAVVASEASARRLSDRYNLPVSCDPQPAWAADVVLLAVKPQQLEPVAASSAGCGGIDQRSGESSMTAPLLISVLAGVRLARLQALFPRHRCIRAVPNTPCLVREGLTGLAWGDGVEPDRRRWVSSLFEAVGRVVVLAESQLDPFLALTSSGPALVALMVESLADGAVSAGMARDLASDLAPAMIRGTCALLQQQGLQPADLKNMVMSPAGTTAAALRVVEQSGLRSSLLEAVVAASERSKELG